MRAPIYLDYMATTPLSPEVRAAMLPWLGEKVGNASSSTHSYGWEAAEAVEQARSQVASLLGASRSAEVAFTSGATESNNTVVRGVADAFAGEPVHVVTTAIEHPSVLAPCEAVAAHGVEVTVVPPRPDGVVEPAEVAAALRDHTKLVSVMAANNETGALQPLAEVAAIAREREVALHVDASQAIGKCELDVEQVGIDFLSVSAHKLHGPIGSGALFARRGALGRPLPPLLTGGGQQHGLRPGTLAVAQVVGLGAAAKLAVERGAADAAHAQSLSQILWGTLSSEVEGIELNGPADSKLPGCLNFSAPGALASAVIANAPGIAVSSGSACSSHSGTGSHVLRAMGLSQDRRAGALRVSFGRHTTAAEAEEAAGILVEAIATARKRVGEPAV